MPGNQYKDWREPQSSSAPPKAMMTAAPLSTTTAAKESKTTNYENWSPGQREENWDDEIVLLLAGKMQDQQYWYKHQNTKKMPRNHDHDAARTIIADLVHS